MEMHFNVFKVIGHRGEIKWTGLGWPRIGKGGGGL